MLSFKDPERHPTGRQFLALALGATMAILSPTQSQAQSYDVDCAILLCMIAGFPSNDVCIEAYEEVIDRITPWPIEPPLQLCTGPSGSIGYNAPEFSGLLEGFMLETTLTSWTSDTSGNEHYGYNIWIKNPDGSESELLSTRSSRYSPINVENRREWIADRLGIGVYDGPVIFDRPLPTRNWVFVYRGIDDEWDVMGPIDY